MGEWYRLDENNEPVPCGWQDAGMEDHERRRVALTACCDGGEVSTVFLALDHQFGDGPPVLWETMVFSGPLDGEQERYTSRADDEAGHWAMVARCGGAA